MAKSKVAITIDSTMLAEIDRLVAAARYGNRSQAIEAAVAAQLERLRSRRLAEECARLLPDEEKSLAEEGLGSEEWPEY